MVPAQASGKAEWAQPEVSEASGHEPLLPACACGSQLLDSFSLPTISIYISSHTAPDLLPLAHTFLSAFLWFPVIISITHTSFWREGTWWPSEAISKEVSVHPVHPSVPRKAGLHIRRLDFGILPQFGEIYTSWGKKIVMKFSDLNKLHINKKYTENFLWCNQCNIAQDKVG